MERNRNGIASTFIAGAGLFDGFLFLAELPRMEHPDLVAAAAALRDHAAHIAQCLDGRIILVLAVGGAKFPCDSARPDRRQKQRDDRCDGPRKIGAAVHGQLHPLMMVSAKGRKGSTRFYRSLRGIAILSMRLSLMVHRDRPCRLRPRVLA